MGHALNNYVAYDIFGGAIVIAGLFLAYFVFHLFWNILKAFGEAIGSLWSYK